MNVSQVVFAYPSTVIADIIRRDVMYNSILESDCDELIIHVDFLDNGLRWVLVIIESYKHYCSDIIMKVDFLLTMQVFSGDVLD